MENREQQLEIIKALNDNRSKLSALFSLYNSSLLSAEEDRAELGSYYEQMIDFRNDINSISNEIYNTAKSDRDYALSRNKSKIKRLDNDVNSINANFQSACKTYRVALAECGSLKAEYKHTVSDLCKEFKASVSDQTEPTIIKGYKQQVKIIKTILDKIEMLIADYNIKKNKMEEDNKKFTDLYDSVHTLITKFEIA